jgi:hypothetical protein
MTLSRPGLVLALLLALFMGLQLLLPLSTAVKIGADEDFELSKATLCAHGYKLYTQIWNDQPPLMTSILLGLIRHISPPILGPRLFSAGLALVLLSALFILVARLSGVLIAGLATTMLVASPGFIELSSSCMQEIPALAPIVAALCVLVVWPSAKWHLGEILAGVLFGFGLQLKLIGVVYLPLAVLVIGLDKLRRSEPLKHVAIASIVLLTTAAIVFAGLNFLTGTPLLLQLQQSWAAHFSSAKSFEYGSAADRPFDWSVLAKNWDTTVPALLGVFALLLALRRHPRQMSFTHHLSRFTPDASLLLLPLAWLALTLVVFTTHRPWWSYYYLHNSIPLSWCAALGFAALGRRLRTPDFGLLSAFGSRPSDFKPLNGARSGVSPTTRCPSRATPQALRLTFHSARLTLFALFCLLSLSWMAARVYLQETGIRASSRLDSCLLLKEISRFKPFTNFLFPYDPIYSFHSDIPVPPHLAMISLKRLWSGEMTTQRLASEVEAAMPGLVLLPNNATEAPFQALLNREYRLVYQDPNNLLYAHRTISRKPLLVLSPNETRTQ